MSHTLKLRFVSTETTTAATTAAGDHLLGATHGITTPMAPSGLNYTPLITLGVVFLVIFACIAFSYAANRALPVTDEDPLTENLIGTYDEHGRHKQHGDDDDEEEEEEENRPALPVASCSTVVVEVS